MPALERWRQGDAHDTPLLSISSCVLHWTLTAYILQAWGITNVVPELGKLKRQGYHEVSG